MSVLHIDFETASTVDLRRTGAHIYAGHGDTKVLCMAYAFGDDPVSVWRPAHPFPQQVINWVRNGGPVAGWNVAFEHVIWNTVLRRMLGTSVIPYLDIEQLEDTMAQAAYWGLPLSLDMAANALRTKNRKDKAGHALMLRMCRPRAVQQGTPLWWHETDEAKYQALVDYCMVDVKVEREIASLLPPLPPDERRTWRMDREINDHGVCVDLNLVERLSAIVDEEKRRLTARLRVVTDGAVTSVSNPGLLQLWLRGQGVETDLRKDTLAALIPTLPDGKVRDALMIRAEAAKASTAKLRVLREATNIYGIMRGMLQYYGANRTGRWAGRLFQPQNLPRPSIKNPLAAVKVIEAGGDAEALDTLFPVAPMSVVSSVLRSCLIASPNCLLFSADLSQIEARVIAWLAGQRDILDVFRRGEDIYVYAANKVGSNDRQYGKVQVLALGFGMGPPKFQTTAGTYGIRLSLREAEEGVYAWRQNNEHIVKFWYACQEAATAIADGEARVQVGHVTFFRVKNHMAIQLPSKRTLFYRNIRVEPQANGRDAVTYDGVNQYTKQYGACRTYGGKLAENITQAVARDVMRDAMLAFHDTNALSGERLVLSVHDEAIGEAPDHLAEDALARLLTLMRTPPSWAPGLPVNAEGWVGKRYRK